MKMLRTVVFAAMVTMAGIAQAAGNSGFTLIVAPSRYAVMQVAFDIVQRHPALLLSYQVDPDSPEPLLHVWSKGEWVRITMQEFREVSFIERMPARTVLLGDDGVLPAVLRENAKWSPEVIRVSSLSASALVNEFGRIMKWPTAEWQWFAKRYNLTLNDESEALRKSSWYDQRGPKPRPRQEPKVKASEPAPVPDAVVVMPPPQPVKDEPAPAPVTP